MSRTFGAIIIGDEILSGKRQDKHFAKIAEMLGVRGLRAAATWPGLLDDQLEAIARAAAAEDAEVWVMAPMVSTVDETEDFVAAFRKMWGQDMVIGDVTQAGYLGPWLWKAAVEKAGFEVA